MVYDCDMLEDLRCLALTWRGKRCDKYRAGDSDFCFFHGGKVRGL